MVGIEPGKRATSTTMYMYSGSPDKGHNTNYYLGVEDTFYRTNNDELYCTHKEIDHLYNEQLIIIVSTHVIYM